MPTLPHQEFATAVYETLRENGTALLSSPQRLYSSLADYCDVTIPEMVVMRTVLLLAKDEEFLAHFVALRPSSSSQDVTATAVRMEMYLRDEYQVAPEVAHSTVTSFCSALARINGIAYTTSDISGGEDSTAQPVPQAAEDVPATLVHPPAHSLSESVNAPESAATAEPPLIAETVVRPQAQGSSQLASAPGQPTEAEPVAGAEPVAVAETVVRPQAQSSSQLASAPGQQTESEHASEAQPVAVAETVVRPQAQSSSQLASTPGQPTESEPVAVAGTQLRPPAISSSKIAASSAPEMSKAAIAQAVPTAHDTASPQSSAVPKEPATVSPQSSAVPKAPAAVSPQSSAVPTAPTSTPSANASKRNAPTSPPQSAAQAGPTVNTTPSSGTSGTSVTSVRSRKKPILPIIVALIVVLGLAAGIIVGHVLRPQIKIDPKTTESKEQESTSKDTTAEASKEEAPAKKETTPSHDEEASETEMQASEDNQSSSASTSDNDTDNDAVSSAEAAPQDEPEAEDTEVSSPSKSIPSIADAYNSLLDQADTIDYSAGWGTPGANADNATHYSYTLIEMTGDDVPELMLGANSYNDSRYLIYYYNSVDGTVVQELDHPISWSDNPNSMEQVSYGRAQDGHGLVRWSKYGDGEARYELITIQGGVETHEVYNGSSYDALNLRQSSDRSGLASL